MLELIKIQSELKVAKNQRNTFGNYNYRSLEDILEAVKPLLKSHKCSIRFEDEIMSCGEFTVSSSKSYPDNSKIIKTDDSTNVNSCFYKAVAILRNEKGEEVKGTSFARHAVSQKGMQDAQLTGATASYARKYALGGLFCLDDTADADATNTHGKEHKPQQTTQPTFKKWSR